MWISIVDYAKQVSKEQRQYGKRNLSDLAMLCYQKILAIRCIPEILKDKNKRP